MNHIAHAPQSWPTNAAFSTPMSSNRPHRSLHSSVTSVRLDVFRCGRLAVSTHVRRHRAVAGVGEGGELLAPGAAELGEPVDEDDRLGVGIAGLGDVHLDAVGRDGAVPEVTYGGDARGTEPTRAYRSWRVMKRIALAALLVIVAACSPDEAADDRLTDARFRLPAGADRVVPALDLRRWHHGRVRVSKMSGVASECQREGRPEVVEAKERVLLTAHKQMTTDTKRTGTGGARVHRRDRHTRRTAGGATADRVSSWLRRGYRGRDVPRPRPQPRRRNLRVHAGAFRVCDAERIARRSTRTYTTIAVGMNKNHCTAYDGCELSLNSTSGAGAGRSSGCAGSCSRQQQVDRPEAAAKGRSRLRIALCALAVPLAAQSVNGARPSDGSRNTGHGS